MDIRTPEYLTLRAMLRSGNVVRVGTESFTCDHRQNELSGRDGGDITMVAGNWLDYVLACGLYEYPEDLTNEAIVAKSAEPFSVPWSRWHGEAKALRDLSDHYPVLGAMRLRVYTFPPPPPPPPPPSSATTDTYQDWDVVEHPESCNTKGFI